jgi:hypothetical protein
MDLRIKSLLKSCSETTVRQQESNQASRKIKTLLQAIVASDVVRRDSHLLTAY